jgi:hypothetical protein
MESSHPLLQQQALTHIPLPSRVPPNLKFEVDDYEDEWTHPKDHFDFVHARFYGQSINDYPKLLEQCYRWAAAPKPKITCVADFTNIAIQSLAVGLSSKSGL